MGEDMAGDEIWQQSFIPQPHRSVQFDCPSVPRLSSCATGCLLWYPLFPAPNELQGLMDGVSRSSQIRQTAIPSHQQQCSMHGRLAEEDSDEAVGAAQTCRWAHGSASDCIHLCTSPYLMRLR